MMWMRLLDICDFQGGSQPPKEEWSFAEQEGYIRMLQIRDFTQSEKVTPEYIKISNCIKTCTEDDVLIARYGASIGKVLTGIAGAYNVAIMRTIPDTDIIRKRFLYYYLKSSYFQYAILNVGSRAAQAGFNKTDLAKLEITCPELSKQDKIVKILEKVESIIQKRKDQLNALDYIIKARFVEMFGDCSNMVLLNDLCLIITDGTHQPPKFQEKGIPFILVSNLSNNTVTYNTEKYISEETYNELYKRTPIEPGDLLLSTVGSYGHPAVVTEDIRFLFQRHIAYLRPKRELVNSFYLHSALLAPDGQRQIEEKVKGIAQKTLNLSEIRKIMIPLPKMEEQDKFAAFVHQVDKSKLLSLIKLLEQLITYLYNVFIIYRQDKGEEVERHE